MDVRLFEKHLAERFELDAPPASDGRVREGWLVERAPRSGRYPIRDGIPRLVEDAGATRNFGLQWNAFRRSQLDSVTGLPLSRRRFEATGWSAEDLAGRTVLEAGCGAGRFTEILLAMGAEVVSFDMSEAVDANRQNHGERDDWLLFQGDVYDLPFPADHFDFVFCYGVLQHTPDPDRAYRALYRVLKPGGRIAIDYYHKRWRPSPWSTPKRVWRPLTRRMRPETLYRIVRAYVPRWLPVDTRIRRVPRLGPALCALIPVPCWNYLDLGLSEEQRVDWAILDTFDALGARYDLPKTLDEVRAMVADERNAACEVRLGGNGVLANVTKGPARDVAAGDASASPASARRAAGTPR